MEFFMVDNDGLQSMIEPVNTLIKVVQQFQRLEKFCQHKNISIYPSSLVLWLAENYFSTDVLLFDNAISFKTHHTHFQNIVTCKGMNKGD